MMIMMTIEYESVCPYGQQLPPTTSRRPEHFSSNNKPQTSSKSLSPSLSLSLFLSIYLSHSLSFLLSSFLSVSIFLTSTKNVLLFFLLIYVLCICTYVSKDYPILVFDGLIYVRYNSLSSKNYGRLCFYLPSYLSRSYFLLSIYLSHLPSF